MYEWTVKYSRTTCVGTRISHESWTTNVYAADENEVRQIMAEEEPGKDVGEIIRGEQVDDGA